MAFIGKFIEKIMNVILSRLDKEKDGYNNAVVKIHLIVSLTYLGLIFISAIIYFYMGYTTLFKLFTGG